MVEVKASIWEVICRSSWMLSLGTCLCETHETIDEVDLSELPRADIPLGIFEAFIYRVDDRVEIAIPIEWGTNLRGEKIILKELRVKISEK
jgi:hypothetical protein